MNKERAAPRAADERVEMALTPAQWALLTLVERLGWGELQGVDILDGEPAAVERIIERGNPRNSPTRPATRAVAQEDGSVRAWLHPSWARFFLDLKRDGRTRLAVLKLQDGLPASWDWDRGGVDISKLTK